MHLNLFLRFLLALAVTVALMLFFRATALTLCTIDGPAFEPMLQQGDRIVVNRWSYGLRTGTEGGLFGYGRLWQQPVRRGDIVVFETTGKPHHGKMLARCKALPGDTLPHPKGLVVVPGIKSTCARTNYYLLEPLQPLRTEAAAGTTLVEEQQIIGKATMVLYHIDSSGIDRHRCFLSLP